MKGAKKIPNLRVSRAFDETGFQGFYIRSFRPVTTKSDQCFLDLSP
jgi:hypothetical protein